MSYDTATTNPDDAALKSRQAELRAFVEDIADHVMSQQLPKCYLEAERAVRAVDVSDRFLQAVPTVVEPEAETSAAHPEPVQPPTGGERYTFAGAIPPQVAEYKKGDASPVRDPWRLKLRVYADSVMDAVTLLQKPENFLEAERAQRYAWAANRMLIQLYTQPKPAASCSLPTAEGLRAPRGRTSKPEKDVDANVDKYGRTPAVYNSWFMQHRNLRSQWEEDVRAGNDPPPLVLPYNDDPGFHEFLVSLWEQKLAVMRDADERRARERGEPWPPPRWSLSLEENFPGATPEDLAMFRPKPPPDTP